MKLNDTKLRALRPREKSYQVADGHGLYVEVMPTGALSFRFAYRFEGLKQKVTLGTYPALTLAVARQRHREMMTAIEMGRNPAKERREQRTAKLLEKRAYGKFSEFADKWLAQWGPGKSQHNVAQARRWLENDCYPILGQLDVAAVRPADILEVVDRVKKRGAAVSARRIRGMLHTLFDYAIDRLVIEVNPVDRVKAKSIAQLRSRNRALSPTEIGRVFQSLKTDRSRDQTTLALRILLLTLVRKSELLQARWDEVNLDAGEWLIPSSRTKTRKAHWVPLARQTVEAFRHLHDLACSEPYVLPHRSRPDDHMSANTLNEAVARLRRGGKFGNLEHFTVHDLRRTGATQLSEMGFRSELIEKALNHDMPGVAGIYNRAEHREPRRQMLQQWADMVDSWIDGAKVTPLHVGKAA